jgi:hypothetical protein
MRARQGARYTQVSLARWEIRIPDGIKKEVYRSKAAYSVFNRWELEGAPWRLGNSQP